MARRPSAKSLADAQDLRLGIGRIARRIRQLYMDSPESGKPMPQIAVLLQLTREGPASPSRLAALERVTTQAIAATVRDLERDHLVTRAPSPTDGRGTIITITDAGRSVLRGREHSVEVELLRALDSACTPSERRDLLALTPVLHRIADHL